MSILTSSKSQKKSLEFINQNLGKKPLQKLLSRIYEEYGGAKTGNVANALKDLGFRYATRGGLTISIEDLSVPDKKKDILAQAEAEIDEATHRFNKGEITEVERYTKVIDTWAQANNDLTEEVVENFDRLNPIYMMAFSGARGSIAQVRQLVGMRGLMADSQGQIIDLPIKSNFKEGLSVTEYIISSYGARKGLVDTALKTADSGYLTRRLVDVAQDVIIEEEDCGTENGIDLSAIGDGVVSLKERLFSRTSAKDVYDADGELICAAGDVFDSDMAQKVEEAGFTSVLIRSPLSCELQYGVCRKCYGWALTSNRLVDKGEAIGIMAAQSIGEPGTQLTMRTFHTGGVFSGSTNREQVVATADGKIVDAVPTREFRTRHGDVVEVTSRDCVLEVKGDKKTEKYNLPFNARVFKPKKGAAIKKGDIIAEYEAGTGRGDARRLTEKATKDIKAGLPGEVYFEGFEADEKRDRQGNITRTANRGGTIWVLEGQVYNLPSGSKRLVDSDQKVKEGDILAETLVISEHGGEVRIPESLVTSDQKVGKEKVKIIEDGKELTIVIASTVPKNAELEQTKKEQLWKVKKEKELYIIKSPVGTTVENESIIAELVDESCMVPSSGEIRYHDVEVDENRTLLKKGKLYFIPEEIHQVSKDASLKMVESGTYVDPGTEVVKGVITRIGGILEIVEDNDIVQEVIVRPGELYRVDDPSTIEVDDGTVVDAKVEVAPGIKTKERSMVSINFQMDDPGDDDDMDDMDDTAEYEYAEVLIRPVQEFKVAPHKVKIEFESSDGNISIEAVTQLTCKDGDKIRQVEGVPLLRTSLVLKMEGPLARLKGMVEEDKKGNLKISVLENLIIRRESAGDVTKQTNSQTTLLVEHNQIIEKGTPVVKTQVLAQTSGTVSLGNTDKNAKDIRRILVIPDSQLRTVKTKGNKVTVKENAYVRMDETLADGVEAKFSGQVTKVLKDSLTMRVGSPYLISAGSQLQVEHNSLVQRGDLIATLIFERQKTGDIVTGLPRVEELLEGRKSKEITVLANYDALAELEWDEDVPKLYLVSDEHGREEITVPLGANILVDDKDSVKKGQALTDGVINPHDLLDILGMDACRRYLVDEVQSVYRSQGVEISDKHIEVIVRQMTKKVKIDESGDSHLVPSELVDEKVAFAEMERCEKEKLALPEFHYVLLGITKASLNTDSFISAASFQETTRVLTEAAIEGKIDILRGLKENVIIGRLIPAGTGFPHFKDQRDEMIEEQAASSRFSSRKPSAILEEIESMFGSPEINKETMGDLILEEDDIVVGDASDFD
ncbi:MAG: DNA-directed RNA polymerase subunit beta'' [Cyanobacteria bacterium HKST-UBA03]|nr:DNA-directed RNA polymerase subunit beta'' [Cyanobacteria bacterium HKST-UBA03]